MSVPVRVTELVVMIAASADDRLRAHTATMAAAQERMRMMVEVPWSYEMLPNWPIEAQFSCVWRLRLLSREVGHGREWIVRQATARGSPARGGAGGGRSRPRSHPRTPGP